MIDATMQPTFVPRTTVLFARAAPMAVVLRRGPRTAWQLLRWDLTTHRFEHGQWLRAANVRLCDVSPNGQRHICFVAQFGRPARPRPTPALLLVVRGGRYGGGKPGAKVRRSDTATIIARVPYFSALAYFPALGTWTGGGAFADDDDLTVREADTGIAWVTPPAEVTLRSGLAQPLIARSATEPEPLSPAFAAAATSAFGTHRVDWCSARLPGFLLFGTGGAIYSLREGRPPRAAERLVDLRTSGFEPLPPPQSALQW